MRLPSASTSTSCWSSARGVTRGNSSEMVAGWATAGPSLDKDARLGFEGAVTFALGFEGIDIVRPTCASSAQTSLPNGVGLCGAGMSLRSAAAALTAACWGAASRVLRDSCGGSSTMSGARHSSLRGSATVTPFGPSPAATSFGSSRAANSSFAASSAAISWISSAAGSSIGSSSSSSGTIDVDGNSSTDGVDWRSCSSACCSRRRMLSALAGEHSLSGSSAMQLLSKDGCSSSCCSFSSSSKSSSSHCATSLPSLSAESSPPDLGSGDGSAVDALVFSGSSSTSFAGPARSSNCEGLGLHASATVVSKMSRMFSSNVLASVSSCLPAISSAKSCWPKIPAAGSCLQVISSATSTLSASPSERSKWQVAISSARSCGSKFSLELSLLLGVFIMTPASISSRIACRCRCKASCKVKPRPRSCRTRSTEWQASEQDATLRSRATFSDLEVVSSSKARIFETLVQSPPKIDFSRSRSPVSPCRTAMRKFLTSSMSFRRPHSTRSSFTRLPCACTRSCKARSMPWRTLSIASSCGCAVDGRAGWLLLRALTMTALP
mmetsp:Transcript_21281/g.49379  ORF Transcript_21281/g.49379 Transcript_21281/m.49379 type:complete len:552 (+) Transcript_21281:582-2237(+)